jgi:ketosteroid isomerase-like protein
MRDNAPTFMKLWISLLALALPVVWAGDSAHGQSKPDSVSAKILALENKWNAAYKRGDVQTMNSLLADDFIITVEDGATYSKSGYIALNGNASVRVVISEMSDLKVRMHGNTAVVTGAYHEQGLSNGKPYDYHDRFTDVWMSINGKWQVIASHYGVPTSQ